MQCPHTQPPCSEPSLKTEVIMSREGEQTAAQAWSPGLCWKDSTIVHPSLQPRLEPAQNRAALKTFSVYPQVQTPLQSSTQARQLGPGSLEAAPTLTCAMSAHLPGFLSSWHSSRRKPEFCCLLCHRSPSWDPGVCLLCGPQQWSATLSAPGSPCRLRTTSMPGGVVSPPGSSSNPGG